jgi:hypothetical protein
VKARTPTPRGTNAPAPRKAEVFAKVELRKIAIAASEVPLLAKPRATVPPPVATPVVAVKPTPKPAAVADPGEMIPIYTRALELASLAFAIIERYDSERYYIRDQLDRKSTDVPQLVSRALATTEMAKRRDLYTQARFLAGDISSILDMLASRKTIDREALEPARALARVLGAELAELAVPPRAY